MSQPRKRQARRWAFILLAMLLGAIVVEGGASLIILGYELLFDRNPGLRSRRHVQYDPTLGWINSPGLELPDFYGPGASLVINEQSFRHRGRVPAEIPPGKMRILCAGDSFTLAIGVGDDRTWCRLLETADARLETVNLGEAGYGLDQIYLKYEERGLALQHDVLLFAFIQDDFARMRTTRFLLYQKPMLIADERGLRRVNVPVPQTSRLALWLRRNDDIVGGLRVVDLGRRIAGRFGGTGGSHMKLTEEQARAVIEALLDRIRQGCRERGCLPLFVYLKQDLKHNPDVERWRRFMAEQLDRRGMEFIDLAREMDELPREEQKLLFDAEWGHYSEKGNAHVQQAIYRRLMQHPAIRARLGEAP